jgi:hypothetical protein
MVISMHIGIYGSLPPLVVLLNGWGPGHRRVTVNLEQADACPATSLHARRDPASAGTNGAQPQEQSKAARQAANNLSHELLICSVYYRIVSECISKHYRGAHVRS